MRFSKTAFAVAFMSPQEESGEDFHLTNRDRTSHISDTFEQTISVSDPWLFENGLMDFLKEIADKYEQDVGR